MARDEPTLAQRESLGPMQLPTFSTATGPVLPNPTAVATTMLKDKTFVGKLVDRAVEAIPRVVERVKDVHLHEHHRTTNVTNVDRSVRHVHNHKTIRQVVRETNNTRETRTVPKVRAQARVKAQVQL